MLSKFVNANTASSSGTGTLPSNTVTNPKEDLKGITTRSGVAYKGPTIPITSSPKVMECETEVTKDTMPPANNESTEDVQPPVVPVVHHESISEPVNAPVSASMPNQKASIPFPSRRNDERRREKANDQIEKFYEIFRDLSFEISFTDALMLMPKFASTLKTLIGNKEKLSEMARTPLNENCSAVILNKLPKKLRDPGRFLIPSDRSISEPIGIAEDVYVTVGKFQFPADFVVVDFEPDPRVPLILGRSFLKTSHALIDVYEGEITLRVGREAITFNLDQTLRYTANYNHMTANRIDVIDMACEEYSQEVLGFSNVISSGNPTPYYDPIVSTSSPTLTPFGDSDFLLFEEADSFLAIEDDPTSPEVDPTYYDPDGDILLLEAILNSDPSPPPPNQGNYFSETRKDLKICEANSSVNEPPEVELKDLPPYLEYAFLEGDDKLPVIIAKDLKNEEKAALIEVLKSHKRAIAWKLSDIKDSQLLSDGIHNGYERFQSLISHIEIHEQKGRDGWNTGIKEGRRTSNRDESISGKKEESRALVTVDGECVDWTTHSEDNDNYAFMANNSTGSGHSVSMNQHCRSSTKVWSDASYHWEYESDSDCANDDGDQRGFSNASNSTTKWELLRERTGPLLIRQARTMLANFKGQENEANAGCEALISIMINDTVKILEALDDESWVDCNARRLLQFRDSKVYQSMDVEKCLSLWKDVEEVYVSQPPEWIQKRDNRQNSLPEERQTCIHFSFKVYEDDFIFGSQEVLGKPNGIFISQDKYVDEILKKFDFANVKSASTPIETQKPLVKDEEASSVLVLGLQVTTKTSHLTAVKRILVDMLGANLEGTPQRRLSNFLADDSLHGLCKKAKPL
ncbi:reverse transcriptase domain-containing protein [Tanacetum coccineum]